MSLTPPPVPEPKPPPSWSLGHWDLPTALLAAAVFGGFYIVSSVMAVLVSIGADGLTAVTRGETVDVQLTLLGIVVNFTGLAIGGVVAVVVLPRMLHQVRWPDLGFRSAGAKWMAVAVALGVGMALVRLPLAEWLLQLSPAFERMAADLEEAFMPQRDLGSLGVIALMTVLVVPFYEELVFRSYVQSALRRWMRLWGAILLSAVLFSVYHLVPLQVIVVFPLAVVLAWIYERTRSLWPCVVAHMANNAVAIGLAYFGS